MTYNVELITKSLEYLEANPEEWNQRRFFQDSTDWPIGKCGTTACLAGTALWLNGDVQKINNLWNRPNIYDLEPKAADALGLSGFEAYEIFYYMTDDIGDLWRKVSTVTGGAVTVPIKYQDD